MASIIGFSLENKKLDLLEIWVKLKGTMATLTALETNKEKIILFSEFNPLHIFWTKNYNSNNLEPFFINLIILFVPHTRQQEDNIWGLPNFPIVHRGWPQGTRRAQAHDWGHVHVFPHAPTLVHPGACHREARDSICTRPTLHTAGSRPKCVGWCRATHQAASRPQWQAWSNKINRNNDTPRDSAPHSQSYLGNNNNNITTTSSATATRWAIQLHVVTDNSPGDLASLHCVENTSMETGKSPKTQSTLAFAKRILPSHQLSKSFSMSSATSWGWMTTVRRHKRKSRFMPYNTQNYIQKPRRHLPRCWLAESRAEAAPC